MEEIIKLPEEYRRSGYVHKLIKCGEHAVMYKVVDDLGNILTYEVFKKLISKAGIARFGGGPPVAVPAKERKPSDESFGRWAWSIPNLGNAGCLHKAAEYFETLEKLKGDLKAFFDFRSPNPLEKHFEVLVGGNKRTIKIAGESDIEVAKAKAKIMLVNSLSKNTSYNVDEFVFNYVGEFYKWGKVEEESNDENVEEEEIKEI